MDTLKKSLFIIITVFISENLFCQESVYSEGKNAREHILIDLGWLFAFGHPYNAADDFSNGTGYFSYFAKAGYGDGAASQHFDDRAWRKLNLPHDWCVELPFDSLGGHSHGYKAIGRYFPENSVGWYRKSFFIPESDSGKRISIEFDGVFRNSIVWVNGFYLGTEHSGYTGFSYDITDYLNYSGENVIAVRVDATMEEGWYYEGAGIYRHVWLLKTEPLHVARYGTFITSDLKNNVALITTRTTVVNESDKKAVFDIEETIVDYAGKAVASGKLRQLELTSGDQKEYFNKLTIANPELWSIEKPYLHKLKTVIRSAGKVVDIYESTFGIRTVRFDANEGFFLNEKPVKILGANMHQDHAGVGTAIPDALQEYRIKRLKDMGANGIRTAHNPPAPGLLNACDRLGMLVLDENRLMGSNEEHFSCLERLIKRDRNHPSVVLWSFGNEEWAIETNTKGERITASMQAFAQKLDSSRAFTVALSGGWDNGSGMIPQVIGYNYIFHGDIDGHHTKFPWQAGIGTEETNTHQTRGIYKTDRQKSYVAPTNGLSGKPGAEYGWQFYAARPFLSGLFYWTGFDYRGESNPFNWPAVINQSGSFDLCGFHKDIFFYFQAWWGNEPVLHILPHWNLPAGQEGWKGSEGKEIIVTVYSNCEQIELFLNNKSQGKQTMPINGHLEWKVKYQPGILLAYGYKGGKKIITGKVETTGAAVKLQLSADRNSIHADGEDVSVITVKVNDTGGLTVPTADNEVSFTLDGPGRIIGVGNGDPASHEPDRFFETVKAIKIENLKELPVSDLVNRPEAAPGFDDSAWKPAFLSSRNDDWRDYKDTLLVVRGTIMLPDFTDETVITLFTKSILESQSIYINGHLIAANVRRGDPEQSFLLDHGAIKPGKNVYAVTGQRFRKTYQWDEPNTDPGLIQLFESAGQWKRKLFSGLAQVIIQSAKQPGDIVLSAASPGLKPAVIKISSLEVASKPAP
jgi:beta-galactosidase